MCWMTQVMSRLLHRWSWGGDSSLNLSLEYHLQVNDKGCVSSRRIQLSIIFWAKGKHFPDKSFPLSRTLTPGTASPFSLLSAPAISVLTAHLAIKLPGSVATTEESLLLVLTLTGKSWTHQQILKNKKRKFQINLFVRTQYLGMSSFQPMYLSGQTQMSIINFWHIDQPWPLLCPFISIQTLDPGAMCCDAFRNNNTTKNKEIFKHAGLSMSSYTAQVILFHSLSCPCWRLLRAWLGAELALR